MTDPEARRRREQQQRVMDLVTLAKGIAGTKESDEGARDLLAEQLPGDLATVEGAISHVAALRTDFLTDRAFRLLTAAHDQTAVRPIDQQVRDLFEKERQLGQLPLRSAFEYLTTLEPRLADLPARVPPAAGDQQARVRNHHAVSNLIEGSNLVGARTVAPDPLLRTDLARKVVIDYLRQINSTGRRDDQTPMFDRTDGVMIGSFALFGRGDVRPRARN